MFICRWNERINLYLKATHIAPKIYPNRQGTIATLRHIARMIAIVRNPNSAGLKLHVITTPRNRPRRTPLQRWNLNLRKSQRKGEWTHRRKWARFCQGWYDEWQENGGVNVLSSFHIRFTELWRARSVWFPMLLQCISKSAHASNIKLFRPLLYFNKGSNQETYSTAKYRADKRSNRFSHIQSEYYG